MKPILCIILFLCACTAWSQNIVLDKYNVEAVGVFMSFEKMDKKFVMKVAKDSAVKEFDEATFAKIKDVTFKDGTIEVKVLSKLFPNAPTLARGFIGVAFRINENNSRFECIYIRPTNARADDQVRRNHSIQYFSFPDYKFQRLRKEFPEKYESYSDMALGQWIKMIIVVNGAEAKLFINDNKEPSLVVNDLKLGPTEAGAVGLFVDIGTDGHFTDLKILK
jgi:hypothetical protein